MLKSGAQLGKAVGNIHLAFLVRYDEVRDQESVSMTTVSNQESTIIRTERGLTITGTRITLYDVMDYVTEQYPPKFIRAMLNLTDEQVDAALAYIDAHRAEVETEYQLVLKEAEELRQYYEYQNRDRIARIAAKPPKPGTEAIRAKASSRTSQA